MSGVPIEKPHHFHKHGSHASVRSRTKRIQDLAVAITASVLLSPVLILVAVLVSTTSRGSALFRQQRIGLNGTPFTMLKFRTMKIDNDDTAHREIITTQLTGASEASTSDGVFKLENDPRITRIGGILRRFSLDELPQLVNVLRGEMSIVGPRPALQMEVDLYFPAHLHRLEVRPGITGLWQVSGRNRLSMLEMLDLDVRYVEIWSIGLDWRIVASTPRVLIRGDGAR